MKNNKTLREAVEKLQTAVKKLREEIGKELGIYPLLNWIGKNKRNSYIFAALAAGFFLWILYLCARELIR